MPMPVWLYYLYCYSKCRKELLVMASNKKIFLKKITIAMSFSRKKICYKIAKIIHFTFVNKNFVKLHNITENAKYLVFSRKKMGFSFFSIDIDNIIFRPRLAFLNNIGTKHIYFSLFRSLSRKKCQVSTSRQCQDFRQRPNFGRKGRPTLVNTIRPSESFTSEMYSQDAVS